MGDRSQTASVSMVERVGTTVDAAAAPSRGGEEVLVGYALTEKKRRSLFSPELLAHARCAIGRPRSTRVADTFRRVTRLSLSLFLGEYFQTRSATVAGSRIARHDGAFTSELDPPRLIPQVSRRILRAHRSSTPNRVSGAQSRLGHGYLDELSWRNIPSDRYFVSD